MSKILEIIETATALKYEVCFSYGSFMMQILLRNEDGIEMTQLLPVQDHLTEYKVSECIKWMTFNFKPNNQ